MNDNYLFSLVRELRTYYSYEEIREIITDYDVLSSQQEEFKPEEPKSVLKALLTEDGKKMLQIRRSIIAASLIVLSTVAISIGFSVPDLYSGIKYALVTAVLAVALWYAISGNDIARFSSLNLRLQKQLPLVVTLNFICIVIPILVLMVSRHLLDAGISINNPVEVGRTLDISIRLIAIAFALIAAATIVLSVRSSILYFTVCVNAIGVSSFGVSFTYTRRTLATSYHARPQLYMSFLPIFCGVIAMLCFAVLIYYLINKGKCHGSAI